MDALPLQWSLPQAETCPPAWQQALHQALTETGTEPPHWAAQLLWQRRLCELPAVPGFVNPELYQPTPASAFGPPMEQAVERLTVALKDQQQVAIWGDFDADGVTATAVLWEGLGQVFPRGERLTYYIPNRLSESHGLSRPGLERLRAWGAQLLVTCDTGSTNHSEIAYAQDLGMEVIVTDHHTLPAVAPPAVALINPRSLPSDHPLATLSGVAVAYKLLEGFYAALASPPDFPLTHLLDLVAIGLIADLVELRADCRYLAQVGLKQLQTHLSSHPPYPRPGVAALLNLCRRTGDRPSDISFGLGPRINAVSRIHGDASFCVELLTSQDRDLCQALAAEAELANTRRKALQQDIYSQVMAQVAQMDLATTQCLVLADEQWPAGVLGLVAGQVSQQLGRPTILLRRDPPGDQGAPRLARGSARSVKGLDLYELFQTQADLLTGFGGHPLAAGLTLPVDHLPMFAAAMNRVVRERLGGEAAALPTLAIDLEVTVADLGQALFNQLKGLEPYGMGNPVPRLLIRQAWFQRPWHKKLRDAKGQTVGFIKTEFELWDDTAPSGFAGEWWGHYKEELPPGRCDVVVELDHNRRRGYHVKLVDVRPVTSEAEHPAALAPTLTLLDWRHARPLPPPEAVVVTQPLTQWSDWYQWQQQAAEKGRPLAIAFTTPAEYPTASELWTQLVGLAKYLARTQTPVSRSQLLDRLSLSPMTLDLGLAALAQVGFTILATAQPEGGLILQAGPAATPTAPTAIQQFLEAVAEEQFRRRYFAQVSAATLATQKLEVGP
ncbi:MAG TPA: single-stranded-DNA-specific exonuclease RecJ [Leptolyngbyaceae cyanobacterium M65_K2018_010]|nr:single-stranded-DNA-specific exonuclease RecJ [Leptolyngbyaceae cyanobacterium M65_K2018_010]